MVFNRCFRQTTKIFYIFDTVALRKKCSNWSFSGPQFPSFGLNTEIYKISVFSSNTRKCRSEKLQIQTLFMHYKCEIFMDVQKVFDNVIHFLWQFLITYSGFRLANIMLRQFDFSSVTDMEMIKTQTFWQKKPQESQESICKYKAVFFTGNSPYWHMK